MVMNLKINKDGPDDQSPKVQIAMLKISKDDSEQRSKLEQP